MSQNEFLLELQAKINEAKSKGLINEDIDKLQKQINKLQLQAEIDPKVILDLTKRFETIINQKFTISGVNVDQNQINKIGQDIGNAISQGVSDASSKAGDILKSSINKEAQNLEILKTKWQEQGILTGDFVNKVKQLETELSKVSSQGDMTVFKKNLQSVQNDIDKFASSGNRIVSTIQKVETEQGKLSKFSNSLFASLKKGFSFFGYWTSFTYLMTSAVRGIKSMIGNVNELADSLTNISYTMDMTDSQLKKIGESSLQMAKDLHTSASNVLGAVKLYANAKETAQSILDKAQPAIMLSNVTGFSGETSAKYLQTIMNQFDLTQDDLMNISDIIQSVSQNVAHDFSDGIIQINEGISTSGEVARAAGMNLADYASMIGLLVEKTGLAGSQLGNSMKTIITRVTKAGKIMGIDEGEISDAEKSLRSVGIEVRKTDGEFKDFNVTMKELSQQWDSLSDVEKSNISFNLAGTRQINVIQTLLRNWSDYEDLVNKANNSTGVTLKNQEIYAESLAGKMGELSGIWEKIGNDAISSSFLKGLADAGIAVSSLVEKVGLLKSATGIGIAAIFGKGRSNDFAL